MQKNDPFPAVFGLGKGSIYIIGNIFQDVADLAFEVIADPCQHRQVNTGDLIVAVAVELGMADITILYYLIFAHTLLFSVLVKCYHYFSGHIITAFH